MGTLADVLNAPQIIAIGGQDYNVRRLSLGELFDAIQGGLRRMQPELKGSELQDATQDAMESGKFPVQAVELILYAAMHELNDGFDMADARAINTLDHIEKWQAICRYASGFDDALKKEQVTPEPEAQASPSTGES
jgi:hypothetical protein